MPAAYEAIIFDMDGVIIDSEPCHEQAFRMVFDQLGYGQTHGIEFADYYGRSDRALWLDFIEKHKPTHTIEALSALKETHFFEMIRADEPIFETLPELVSRLRSAFPLAVASGSTHPVIDVVLAMQNLRQHFQAIVSATDVARGKPWPDIFLRAAELLGVNPARCCVIEDSAAGVEAALAANMDVIGITNSLPAGRLARATHVVSTYAEIDQILLGDPRS